MTEELDPSSEGKIRIETLSANAVVPEGYCILVTECEDGSCYADGLGFVDDHDVLYISKVEDDQSLALGIRAAEDWAVIHNVSVIYIQPETNDSQA